jgi:hypothetical protein
LTPPDSELAGGAPRRSRRRAGDALIVLLAGLLAAVAVRWGAATAAPARLSLGPNDPGYVQGFRQDWERDGHTRFRWTGRSARVLLPLYASGSGLQLRMRVRRHFRDPATVAARVEGRVAGRFEIAGERDVAYRVERIPLPPLTGRHPFVVDLDVGFENRRPLGVVLDWIALDRGQGRFRLDPAIEGRAALALISALAVLWLVGATRIQLGLLAAALVAGLGFGVRADIVAAERILREGLLFWFAVAGAVALLLGLPRSRRALGIESGQAAGALASLVFVGLALRLTLLLHTLYFYPDVRVHALFSQQLARHGLMPFLRDFTVNQYRYSLGLQFENGHWYAFPYPPAFYVLTWPLVQGLQYRAEIAVSGLAAALNALEMLLVFGIARTLQRSGPTSLAAATAAAVLPLFMVRLSLAYFPALAGHALDALVLWLLLRRLGRIHEWRSLLGVGVAVAAALLAYTQAVVNFGLLFGSLLVAEAIADRSSLGRRRLFGLAAAGSLGALLALLLFYGRYIPVFVDMQRGIPMAEEQILLDKMERQRATEAEPEPQDDPYAGPGVVPLRGLQKAAWRLWLFYGPFALLVVGGWLMLIRDLRGPARRFVACWGLAYLWLSLGSGGLPGPNLLRYNKELELVAPLSCIALAVVAAGLWRGGTAGRALATALAGGYLWMGLTRWREALLSTFDLTSY